MAERINSENFDEQVLNADGLVAVDFYSDSCVPCKRMSPLLARLEEERSDITLLKLNVNFDTELASQYGVASVPTIVFFNGGEEKARITGAASLSQIIETIESINSK
ncbi:MAG: thioredoxin family protein [Oscillospiraceae bacterium]